MYLYWFHYNYGVEVRNAGQFGARATVERYVAQTSAIKHAPLLFTEDIATITDDLIAHRAEALKVNVSDIKWLDIDNWKLVAVRDTDEDEWTVVG